MRWELTLPITVSAADEEAVNPRYKAHDFSQLNEDQKAMVIQDVRIDLKDYSACSIVHLSYRKDGTPVNETGTAKQLPYTGQDSTTAMVMIGLVTFAVGVVLLYKNKRGKIIAILLVSSTISSIGLNKNLHIHAQDLYLQEGHLTFVEDKVIELPKLEGYQYVGYWIDNIPCDAPVSPPVNPPVDTSKKIKLRYVFANDPNERDIAEPKELTIDQLNMNDFKDAENAIQTVISNLGLVPRNFDFDRASLPASFNGSVYETNPDALGGTENRLYLDNDQDNVAEQYISKVFFNGDRVQIKIVYNQTTGEIKEVIVKYVSYEVPPVDHGTTSSTSSETIVPTAV